MKIFDTHAHYDDEAFDPDRDELLGGYLQERGVVNITNIGCDIATSRTTLELAEGHDYIYGAIGVIPHYVGDMTEDDIELLRDMARSSDKIVAIGEIGLDYHYDEPAREVQHRWFVRQMELARELGLPIVIHSRDAAQDTVQLMRSAHAEDIGGVVHCYSYSEEMSREFIDMGFYFGIGGVVTFKNSKKLKRAVRSIPLDRIVLETDSPYLAPTPNRGKRNDSSNLIYVVREIVELKGITEEEVIETTYRNAVNLYRLKNGFLEK